jgi:hypothetical protein
MPYTPTPIDLVTPADSVHGCFEVCNENFSDIEATLLEISSLVSGSGFDYFKTGLTGGTSGMLDQVDGDGLTGDERAVVVVGNNPARVYFYVLDVDNAGAEDSPYIIAPDTNAGDKRWVLAARIPRTWKGSGTPTTTDDYDDGVRNGDWWIYGGNAYMCVSETAGNAVWRIIPQIGTGATNAAAGDHNHSTNNIASTAISDWLEAVQDSAGGMWTGNTETGLSVTYDDSTGKLNASVTYGTDANTACQGNDARLSDARDPNAHSHTESEITDLGSYSVTGHTHAEADITDLGDYAASSHSHTESDITDLQDYLLGDSVLLEQITTPESVALGYTHIYAKSDGKVYKKNNGGDEEEIGTGGGSIIDGAAGEDLAAYDVVYASAGEYFKAQSDNTEADAVGIVTEALGIASAAIGEITLGGLVTNAEWSWTPGSQLYLSGTYGGITETKPTALGDYIKPLGFAVSSTQIYFDPQVGIAVDDYSSLDGDQVVIDWNPSNYTPEVVTETSTVDHLSSHLKGIDARLTTFPSTWYWADQSFLAKTVSVAADRYKLLTPNAIQIDIGGSSYTLAAQATLDLSQEATWDTVSGTDYRIASNRAGKDFYIYLCQPGSGTAPVVKVSANSTTPSGYTAANSRKVGGFPCLCVAAGTLSGHPANGYVAGDIIPIGVWDLKFRAANGNNAGMAYVAPLDTWIDIYLASGTGASTASANGGTISDTRTWLDFIDDGAAVKKHMLRDYQFQIAAAGSNEETNIAGSADPGTTGGHSDTASRRMISNYFLEDCCGAMWQWLDEQSTRWDFATAWGWYDLPGSKGSLYNGAGAAGTGDVKLIAGGNWSSGAGCGSRSRDAGGYRWGAFAFVGCRFAARSITK